MFTPPFRQRPAAALLLLFAAGTLHADKPRKPKAPAAAATYPLHQAHAAEHVTIAAEPGDTRETEPDTRLDYFHHGFLPMRVVVTNDSDQPLDLSEARILFAPANNAGNVNAATEDEIQRRLFTTKNVKPTRIPLGPLPSITIHHAPVDKKIAADMDDFGFANTTVAPHSTAAGYLFYDTRDIDEPVLENATLELRRLKFADAAGKTGKSLDTFEIPLKPTPDAGSKKPDTAAPKDKTPDSKPAGDAPDQQLAAPQVRR